MRDIVLYCVSMDEIQLSAVSSGKDAGFDRFPVQKWPDVKFGNDKIIQEFTCEFGPLEKMSVRAGRQVLTMEDRGD